MIWEPAVPTILGLRQTPRSPGSRGHRVRGYGVRLFGVEGLQVTDVQAGPDGVLAVWAVTDYPPAAACPDCGVVSDRVHERVLTRPRDVRRAGDVVGLRWVKVRRKCGNGGCPRKTFTWLSLVLAMFVLLDGVVRHLALVPFTADVCLGWVSCA